VKGKNYSDVTVVCQDANKIEYQGDNILVINTSTNDIVGTEWLRRIPMNSVVAIQGKNKQEVSNGIESLSEFNKAYPLKHTLFVEQLRLFDVNEKEYDRFMKIGQT
jgi:hypothetical protein